MLYICSTWFYRQIKVRRSLQWLLFFIPDNIPHYFVTCYLIYKEFPNTEDYWFKTNILALVFLKNKFKQFYSKPEMWFMQNTHLICSINICKTSGHSFWSHMFVHVRSGQKCVRAMIAYIMSLILSRRSVARVILRLSHCQALSTVFICALCHLTCLLIKCMWTLI